MKKAGLLFSMFVLSLGVMFSQTKTYAFKVLAAKGSNQFLTKGQWSSLAAGVSLVSGEKVKVIEGGYVGLIHQSGKTMELKTAGTFNISDLEAKVIQSKTNFGEKYGDFVSDGMFASNPNAGSNYNKTGSVHRGILTPIFLYAPTSIKAVKSEPLTLHWNDCGGRHTFVVTMSDYFGNEIYAQKTTTNSHTIDFSKIKLQGGLDEMEGIENSFVLTIKSLTNPDYTTAVNSTDKNAGQQSFTIDLVSDSDAKKIAENLNKVKAGLDKNSALDYMVLAMEFEKLDMMAYAVDCYSKAKTLAPNVDEFKLQYEEYIKTKLKQESLVGSKGN